MKGSKIQVDVVLTIDLIKHNRKSQHWISGRLDSVHVQSSSRLWDLDFQMYGNNLFILGEHLGPLSNSPVVFVLSPDKTPFTSESLDLSLVVTSPHPGYLFV